MARKSNGATLSPDGKVLCTASKNGVVLWDVATGRRLHLLQAAAVPDWFDPNQSLVSFSPDGRRVVSMGGRSRQFGVGKHADPALHIWDVATGKETLRIPLETRPGALNGDIGRCVWFSPDGKEVIAATRGDRVWAFRATDGTLLRSFSLALSGKVDDFDHPLGTISPDGKLLAVLAFGKKKHVVVVNLATGKVVRRITANAGIDVVAFSHDGNMLAAGGADGIIRLYESATGKQRSAIRTGIDADLLHKHLVVLAFAPDGNTLLAANKRGRIHRWAVGSGKALPTLAGHEECVTALLVAPDSKSLVSVGWDFLIRRWDLESGRELSGPDGFQIAFKATRSPDGRYIAVGDATGRLELLDATSGRRVRALRDSVTGVDRLRWSPDGKRLAVARGDKSVAVWDLARAEVGQRLPMLTPLKHDESWWWRVGLAFTPNGQQLLTTDTDNDVRLWDLSNGTQVWHQAGAENVAVAPDGKTVVEGGWENELRFREADTGRLRLSVDVGESSNVGDYIDSIAFAPDGSVLATGHQDGTVRLRDPRSGEERSRLTASEDHVLSVAFSTDGKWLVTGAANGVVHLWEVATGKELLRRAGHQSRVCGVEFGPDGMTALSTALDFTALLWNLHPGKSPPVSPALWDDLVAADAAVAYRALWALRDDAAAGSALLRAKLPPVPAKFDEKRARQFVAALDSDRFEERETASRALAVLGPAVLPLLKKELDLAKSPDVKKRLQVLVDDLTLGPGPEEFRRLRAVRAMELAGTPAARELLRAWAGGLADAPLTKDAGAALARLQIADRQRGD